ncbi:MAG TPA: M23 family metallopeptidase [Candidatus Paceibacterota bacterium]
MIKKWPIILACVALVIPAHSFAAASAPPIVKLPYAKGQSFVVTQGYDTPPTHIKKDSYALDLTQNGCDAYGKAVVAAASGTAMFLSQEGYNGGYGTELIIDHGGNIVSRYAHMIPDSITIVATGTAIRQGQTIGLVGDTGLVAGLACAAHPGTHVHFAMDTVNADGTFSAYDPEPISGYTDMTAGKWYLSDNGTMTSMAAGEVLGAYDVATTTTTTTAITTNATSTSVIVFSGGVSVTPAVTLPASISSSTASSTALDNDSTSTDDATDASSTADAVSSATTTTSTAPAAPQSGTLFEQFDDSVNSPYSFYDDNWFDLGNGFSGMLTTLTLEGKVSDGTYFASHVALQEFKDSNYTAMVEQFPISDNAPFTAVMATATFSGLSIPLKPYFYYRLTTLQDYQNRSVILAGTASTTVGVAMAHNFIYGTGGVETTSTFFPFITMGGVGATSTLAPPPLTSPGDITESFDELNMQLTPSWSTSTDPDWAGNPLSYEMNYSTSTSLSDDNWMAPGAFPIVPGYTYLIGIRAVDNYGDVSAVASTTWDIPPGFTPYLLSPDLNYAYQYFTVAFPSALQSITLFTTDFKTGAKNQDGPWCTLDVFDEYDLASLGDTPADNTNSGFACAGTPTFSFASSLPVLLPGHMYHWVFTAQTGNPLTAASVQFYGNEMNTAGGGFSDPSLLNAKFTLTGPAGAFFEN